MELKPCPFCGHTEMRVSNPDSSEMWISCNKCHAGGPVDITPTLVGKKWNRRAPAAPPVEARRDAAISPDWTDLAKWTLERLRLPIATNPRNIKFLNEQLQAMWKCGFDCAAQGNPAPDLLKAAQSVVKAYQDWSGDPNEEEEIIVLCRELDGLEKVAQGNPGTGGGGREEGAAPTCNIHPHELAFNLDGWPAGKIIELSAQGSYLAGHSPKFYKVVQREESEGSAPKGAGAGAPGEPGEAAAVTRSEVWVIPHPGTGNPIECPSFEMAMDKWFEGFNLPKLRLPNGALESNDTAYNRVKDHMNQKRRAAGPGRGKDGGSDG